MKFWKFQVESIFCHLQAGSYEFKIPLWMNTEKYLKKLHHETIFLKLVKEKHSIYKKSVCMDRDWRMKLSKINIEGFQFTLTVIIK